jgi:hypothetical protein
MIWMNRSSGYDLGQFSDKKSGIPVFGQMRKIM